MPLPKYNQDFYISSASFIEGEAKKEGRIVIFQVDKQDNGKKRAVNVRCITKSDEDVQLALSYYGDHEYIEYKDNRKINLYTNTFKPLGMVADKVRRIIEEDAERSPEKTSAHFKFFVDHYKQNEYSKDRYIFDRQFSTEEKSIWLSLFSVFTDEEQLAVLKIYPTIVKYFNDASIIQKWLEQTLNEDSTISDWQEVEKSFEYIPDECVRYAKQRIETLVDGKIGEVFQELSTRSDISEEDLDASNEYNKNVVMRMYVDCDKQNAVSKLWSYLSFTSKQYEEERAKCLALVKKNRFKKELAAFVGKQYNDNSINDFFNYLNNLATDDFLSFKEELVLSISSILDKAIEENNYGHVVNYIRELTVMGEEFLNPYKYKLLPLIKDALIELVRDSQNSPSRIKSDCISAYEYYSSIYEESEKVGIKQELIPILKETQSIGVLSEVSTGFQTWLTIDEALVLSKQIVSHWGYEELKDFVIKEQKLFDRSIAFANIVVARTKEVVGTIPLCHFFDGTSLEENYSRYPERENCAFLKELEKLIPYGQHSSEWDDYINSRSVEDLLILYEHDVIMSVPANVVEIIINTISLDGVYANKGRWYRKPTLKNRTHAKVLETTEVNLFPLIAQRLQTMEMNDENVSLAVLLTELMTANMPDSEIDYYTRREWDTSFTSQIQEFKKANDINQRLAVIWWAIHSRTTTSAASLTEVFAILPPYLQIKIVKKVFGFMSEGRIHHTVESFYCLISNGKRPICFPLEIAFAYLKLRKKDQTKTLDNNIMLQLLEGREDTDEWIGIRDIVTQCSGRWVVNELPNDKHNWKRNNYFNGIISKEKDGRLRVFIPQKMVDENGNIKEYNNKYYARTSQYIQITYKEDEYQIVKETNGVSYYFDETYEVELFAIARPFNFKYNGLNNFVGFETIEQGQEEFCECRLSDKVDNYHGLAFYWCGNKPCFRPPVKYRTDDEWEHYTILDFMRILGISSDYINKKGKRIKFGHYIILSSYLRSFSKFYEHLKCRECGKLMKPSEITNFTSKAVTEFSCINDKCQKKGTSVYLNHCFNTPKCNATIDSRDSKQCPNGLYICPECGACCSTENFKLRISHLHMTGGFVSDWTKTFVEQDIGHWEKQEYYCHKCGDLMLVQSNGYHVCPKCGTEYNHHK